MKNLSIEQLENISGSGYFQDAAAGFACGMAIAAAVTSGGLAIPVAIGTCALAYGDW